MASFYNLIPKWSFPIRSSDGRGPVESLVAKIRFHSFLYAELNDGGGWDEKMVCYRMNQLIYNFLSQWFLVDSFMLYVRDFSFLPKNYYRSYRITNSKINFLSKGHSTYASKIPFISNLEMPTCASKWDLLELATLQCSTWRWLCLGIDVNYLMASLTPPKFYLLTVQFEA